MAMLESLDNRIKLQHLEKEISALQKVISALEAGTDVDLPYRNSAHNLYIERCQVYSAPVTEPEPPHYLALEEALEESAHH